MSHSSMSPAIGLDNLTAVGHDLMRPESVQTMPDGTLYASHRGGGVMRIGTDGSQRLIGREGLTANGHEIFPNGIFPLGNGSFLLANIGEGGGVWTLHADGQLEPYLLELDGYALSAANFVTRDRSGRIWITVSTVSHPRFAAYSSDVADGLVIVVDARGARVVADDICFANECRISPQGDALFLSETFSRRVTRFDVDGWNELGSRDVFFQLGRGDFPDGCRFDAAGHLWLTSIVGNRVYRLSPRGQAVLVLEDYDAAHVDEVETALAEGRMGREHFYKAGGRMLANVASIDFSPAGDRAFLGSLCGSSIMRFDIPDGLRNAA